MKQETLHAVTIAMIAPLQLYFENSSILRDLYMTQSNIFDGAFIAKIVSR